jgi:transposase-like protein
VAAKAKSRQFPTALKLKVIERAEQGEGILPVARKLGISR